MISTISAGAAFSSSVAVAPNRSGKIASPRPEREGQRRRADEDIVLGDVEDFLGVAVRNDHEVAVEMHRRLGFARGARGKSEQGDVVAARLHRVKLHRLVQRHPVKPGIMVGGTVEIHHLLEEAAGLRARDQFVGDAAVGQRQRDLGLVDDFSQFAGTQHRHRVDDDGARLGGRKPGRDQRRVVAGTDQDAVAGLDAVVLHQRMREAV